MKKLIVVETLELKSIKEDKAYNLIKAFIPYAKNLNGYYEEYTKLIEESKKGITKEFCLNARELRLKILKIRTGSQEEKCQQKEESLKYNKAIDSLGNLFKNKISNLENELKEIENYFEIKEQERLELLQKERENLAFKYTSGEFAPINYRLMNQETFDFYLAGKKKTYEDRLEAEKKAEADRIAKEKAEAEERERIKKENEELVLRLKKEEADRKRREKSERRRQEKHEAELRKEREERERIAAELKAKEEAERKKVEEAELNSIKIICFEDLTADQKENVPNNGCGKKYANYIRIKDKDGIRIYSDAMEPEDCIFTRDLSWIVEELKKK